MAGQELFLLIVSFHFIQGVHRKGLTSVIAYTNNTFTFAAADTGFPENVIIEKGITASKPVSADGGKTWTVAQITIPDSKYGSSGFIAA